MNPSGLIEALHPFEWQFILQSGCQLCQNLVRFASMWFYFRILALVSPGCLIVSHALAAELVPSEREALIGWIRTWQQPPQRVPLDALVEALSGYQVLDWQGEERAGLTEVGDALIRTIGESPLSASRPNEIGNQLEDVVSSAIEDMGWLVGRPAGPSGRRRSVGYPDLEFKAGDRAFYLEVKAFSSGTERSTQRTFYLSPSDDFKVTRDAFHLLLACEIVSVGQDTYGLRSVKWLDLHALECRLKHEFNASNRDLYSDENELVILERPVE